MNFPYQFFIALRYFRSKKKHSGISINTLISIAGVALGVAVLLIVLSVMSGFHEDLQEKILGANSHIIVLSYGGRVADHDSVIEIINGVDGVTDSSPVIYGQVMLRSGDRAQGVVVRGVDPRVGAVTTNILDNIVSGSIEGLEEEGAAPGIILGRNLLRSLGLFVGDEIDMISPVGEMGPLGMVPKMKKFRVAGYFEAGMYEYDSSLAFVSLKAAQKFFGYGDAITGIEIRTNDVYNAGEVGERVELRLGPSFYAKDWMQMNRNLFSALKLEKIVMFIILTLIILVASFNIISNLIMIVIEKGREIAIMKAMGATNRGIMYIFMIHGLIIGVVGTMLGIIVGYVACLLLNVYEFPLAGDVYYLSHLPVRMNTFDFIVVPAAALIISFLATIYPSWQAAKTDPVEPLRYE